MEKTRQARRSYLRIGELAASLGLNPKTIRYYEAIGLLPVPRRTPAGYRLYDPADRERLRFIGKAKALGLTLEEIGEILALRADGQQPCEHVLELVDRKITAVDQQVRALLEFREDLLALRADAAETMTGEADFCAIIEQHEAPDHEAPPARAVRRPASPGALARRGHGHRPDAPLDLPVN